MPAVREPIRHFLLQSILLHNVFFVNRLLICKNTVQQIRLEHGAAAATGNFSGVASYCDARPGAGRFDQSQTVQFT
jgi:hypothetical protein